MKTLTNTEDDSAIKSTLRKVGRKLLKILFQFLTRRTTRLVVIFYVAVFVMIGQGVYAYREDFTSSVESFLKSSLTLFVVLFSIYTIIKAFRRDRGNFGREQDNEVEDIE